ncbi:hypothetical protein DERP_001260 [Dermatophagoides pteronyssinus]|uniref:Uncharacterized protein n=1 Tax=Dermatophagoides pteronyssinus TaxID=6956 RepID=A0ABQ8JDZ0_DERPT|nr:hypothetical protein DERP_001260 [Dermatophagoides pteronyssinus]
MSILFLVTFCYRLCMCIDDDFWLIDNLLLYFLSNHEAYKRVLYNRYFFLFSLNSSHDYSDYSLVFFLFCGHGSDLFRSDLGGGGGDDGDDDGLPNIMYVDDSEI